jgi:uncharacterized protein
MIQPAAFTTDGAVLRGALHLPDGSPTAKYPVVVFSHGLGALQEWVHPTAEVFTQAGIACLTYDTRGFGLSDGYPRQEADPWKVMHDLRAAIDYLHTLPQVDTKRIGIWGTCFGGGPAMVAAAVDRRVRALVTQVPLGSGGGLMRAILPPDELASLGEALDANRVGIISGRPPAALTQTSIDPSEDALASDDETYTWMTEEAKRTPHWINQLTLQTVDRLLEWEPADYLPRVAPTPVLLIVAQNDQICPERDPVSAFDRVDGPKELVWLESGGHYGVYKEHFDLVSGKARDWFVRHLSPSATTGRSPSDV